MYLARHLELDEWAAIKILHHDLATSQGVLRFNQEVRLVAQIDHPNVIRVRSYGVSHGRPYMVMEHLKGRSLKEILSVRGRLSPIQTKQIMLKVCQGLEAAHAVGVVHRDLKPGNIMICGEEEDEVKLLDFGIARIVTDETFGRQDLTGTGVVIGTADYMSPEQCVGGAVDFRSDIYAVGCVLYECLAGYPPFRADNNLLTMSRHLKDPLPIDPAVRSQVGLLGVVRRCMQKLPEERYQDVGELSAELKSTKVGAEVNHGRRLFGIATGVVAAATLMGLIVVAVQRLAKPSVAPAGGVGSASFIDSGGERYPLSMKFLTLRNVPGKDKLDRLRYVQACVRSAPPGTNAFDILSGDIMVADYMDRLLAEGSVTPREVRDWAREALDRLDRRKGDQSLFGRVNSACVLMWKARLQGLAGQTEGAEKTFAAALARKSDLREPALLSAALGSFYARQCKWIDAIRYWEMAAAEAGDPLGRVDALQGVAGCRSQLNDLPGAAVALRKALGCMSQIAPNSGPVTLGVKARKYQHLARQFHEVGLDEEAQEAHDKAAEVAGNGKLTDVLLEVSRERFDRLIQWKQFNQLERAVESTLAAAKNLEVEPPLVQVFREPLEKVEELRRPDLVDKMLDCLGAKAQSAGRKAELNYLRGACFHRRSRFAESAKCLELAIMHLDESGLGWDYLRTLIDSLRVSVYCRLERYREAVSVFESVKGKLAQDKDLALYALDVQLEGADAYHHLKDYTRSNRLLSSGMNKTLPTRRDRKRRCNYLFVRAKNSIALNDGKESARLENKLAHEAGKEAHYWSKELGRVYLRHGDEERADQCFVRALEQRHFAADVGLAAAAGIDSQDKLLKDIVTACSQNRCSRLAAKYKALLSKR